MVAGLIPGVGCLKAMSLAVIDIPARSAPSGPSPPGRILPNRGSTGSIRVKPRFDRIKERSGQSLNAVTQQPYGSPPSPVYPQQPYGQPPVYGQPERSQDSPPGQPQYGQPQADSSAVSADEGSQSAEQGALAKFSTNIQSFIGQLNTAAGEATHATVKTRIDTMSTDLTGMETSMKAVEGGDVSQLSTLEKDANNAAPDGTAIDQVCEPFGGPDSSSS